MKAAMMPTSQKYQKPSLKAPASTLSLLKKPANPGNPEIASAPTTKVQ